MKYQTMIRLVAGPGLIPGSVNASASGFGGGWMHDSSGTLSNSDAPRVMTAVEPTPRAMSGGFGGGWAHDNTGTLTSYL